MLMRQIYDEKLAQYAYLIGCQKTGTALVIDPERDIDRYTTLAAAEGLTITAVAETHIHADFLSGARELAHQLGARLYVSAEGGADWQYRWLEAGEYSAQLLHHGDHFQVGNIEIQAIHTPGHTPEHLCFLVTDRGAGSAEPMGMASGDFVFVGDLGRPDLLESAAGQAGAMRPAAAALFRSVQQFLTLPEFVQIWPGHGAGSACGKALGAVPASTVGYELRNNSAIRSAQQGQERFIDAILAGQPEPPLYFGRMKQLNKDGPPLLGALPRPAGLSATELAALVRRADAVILDTRQDRRAFMAGHLPGALWAPLDRTFPTIAGSYVDPEHAIYLLVPAARVEEAVRALVRIGLDQIRGFAPPEILPAVAGELGGLRQTAVTAFAELPADGTIVDVRGSAEYAAGHIPGALNIPHTRLRDQLAELPAGTLIVHCAGGVRAAAATALLERHGHAAVHVDDVFAHWRPNGQ